MQIREAEHRHRAELAAEQERVREAHEMVELIQSVVLSLIPFFLLRMFFKGLRALLDTFGRYEICEKMSLHYTLNISDDYELFIKVTIQEKDVLLIDWTMNSVVLCCSQFSDIRYFMSSKGAKCINNLDPRLI